MDRRNDEINLAALLDGELRDDALVEALQADLERDQALRAEFEAQQEVKSLLGGLGEYKAPDFLATRVLGEISARRRAQARPRWRPAVAWLGGAAALLAGFGSTVGLLLPRAMQNAAPVLADSAAPGRPVEAMLAADSGAFAAQPGLFTEVRYAPQVWEELPMPAGDVDHRVQEFLQFASEAHEYRRLLRGGNGNAGMADAVLVLDGDAVAQLHWASDK